MIWYTEFRFEGRKQTFYSVLMDQKDATTECIMQFIEDKDMFFEDATRYIWAQGKTYV